MKQNVVNEKLQMAFEDGYADFSKVVLRKGKFFHQVSNPMKKNTTLYKEWQRGWDCAYFNNLEKINGLGARS